MNWLSMSKEAIWKSLNLSEHKTIRKNSEELETVNWLVVKGEKIGIRNLDIL